MKRKCVWCDKWSDEKEMIEFGSVKTASFRYGGKRRYHKRQFWHKECLKKFFQTLGEEGKFYIEELGL